MAENKKNSSLLYIRFIGEDLDKKSVPIYLLGESFISFQRIINKAYLANNNRLGTNWQLTNSERENLALQVGERKKESDGYGFIPFQLNPEVIEMLKSLVPEILISLGKYAYQRIKTRNDGGDEKELVSKDNQDEQKQPISENNEFVSSIHKDLLAITRGIEGIGGIKEIHLSVPDNPQIEKVVINIETKGYLRYLASETFLGKTQEITGKISKLEPGENIVTILKKYTNKSIRIYATSSVFNEVRYSKIRENEFVTFTGRPIHHYGEPLSKFSKFEATTFYREQKH